MFYQQCIEKLQKIKTKAMSKTEKLEAEFKKIRSKYNDREIIEALGNITGEDAFIQYLQIEHNLNVVKLETLNQKAKFEEMMSEIMPYDNERQANLFLSY